MPLRTIRNHGAGEQAALEEMTREGFAAEVKNYEFGRTEPHHHDYDVCLYILEGEIRVTDVDAGTVHAFQPRDMAFVDRGTTHAEEHGNLRMIVGRRH